MLILERALNLLLRNRARAADLTLLISGGLLAIYLVWQINVFVGEHDVSAAEKVIELDEALLIGGGFSLGLYVFSVRRLLEQKREARRRTEAEQTVRVLAYQDALTGLPNRRQFDEALKIAIESPPGAGLCHAVFLLDLNGFKKINDVHGHGIGDEVLIVLAQRLMSSIREGDLVARFGGDEFAILARHLIDAETAAGIARRVIKSLEAPISTGHLQHQVGAAIGISLVPADADSNDEAVRKADVALYRAKALKRSAFQFFEVQMDQALRDRDFLEQELRRAVLIGDIELCYQPQIDLRTREIIGFEALPRWQHPELGEIPADRFISIAEDVGLIHQLADNILCQACVAAAGWPDRISLSIDIYPALLADASLKSRILGVLQDSGLSPERLELEIAECVLVQHLDQARDNLSQLRERGIRIVLGNFGTGYTSLYHLRNFKLDKIKIDRTFVEAMHSSAESAGIVDALIGLGRGFGYTVSAEGVGDSIQHSTLVGIGCDQGQGSLFSGAVPAEIIPALLDQQHSAAATSRPVAALTGR